MRKRIRIISPVRKDRIVKARNESKKTNFMTVLFLRDTSSKNGLKEFGAEEGIEGT